MKKVIATIAAMAISTSSFAFFGGGDDNQSGYGNFNSDGAFDGRGRGAGKGDMDAEGNFSMTINASGKAHSNVEADMDGANNSRFNGITDVRTENSPAYYGIQPYSTIK